MAITSPGVAISGIFYIITARIPSEIDGLRKAILRRRISAVGE